MPLVLPPKMPEIFARGCKHYPKRLARVSLMLAVSGVTARFASDAARAG
jgi:hypothetical protein